ncbi:UPF0182 family protein [Streptomyces sp. TR06-5]|uniref:UPF0182 family membrane protein n=1 Tax=Streptomyces sp. TR06-5 TaxID=3385976 RepID=UPI00399F2D9B
MPDRGSGGPTGPRIRVGRPSRRARTLLMTAGVLAVLAMLFVMFAGFWTDWLWYHSVDYSEVFTTTLLTKIGLFAVFGLLMAVVVGLNMWLAHRLRPPLSAMSLEQQSLDRYRMGIAPYKKWILLGASALVGLISGASAAGQWRTWLMWVNGVAFGQTDPQFGKDISFYTFDLPWYRFLLGFGFATTVLALITAGLVHYLYGGLRMSSPGARATSQATGHLSVLLGVFVALKAAAYWLDRYGLAVKGSDFKATENWTGLKYVDANAYLPAKTILFIIAIICALLFFGTLWRRTWQLPVIGFGLMVLSAILIGGLYPAIVQKFQVEPNEQAKETPYIKKNINATRSAYNIADAGVRSYSGTTDAGDEELRNAANTTASLRLLDPNVVSPTFQQQQQQRGYYEFPETLDVDRYSTESGRDQDTVVGLREIDPKSLPKQGWINEHFKYTHGFGMVAAKGTEVNKDGEPVYIEENLPPKGQLGTYEPRIYFGEKTTKYSVVGGPQEEIDYVGDKEKTYSYKGKGGIELSNPFSRAAYAVSFSEPRILYSGAIGEGSQILYNRTPKDRVEAVAPWLTIDGDPYPAVVDGRVKWIVDAYTTTNNYPYSSRTTLGDTTTDALTDSQRSVVTQQNRVNYIRNSVKATVDAYSGEVELYEWDTGDPVLKTWMKAFPGTVQPKSDIGPDLKKHLRYPQDLFKVQRELLTRYHVTDPAQFYSGSERWQIPDDPTSEGTTAVPPYYLSMQLPGEKQQTFSLTTTFNPVERKALSAFMAVDANATSANYGRIDILRLPSNTTVPGPQQVQSNINSDPEIADDLNILKRGDSTITYGNLLTVPIKGGLLYVEPVYIEGANTSYPRMRKVVAVFGERVAFENTLPEALNEVFQTDGGGMGQGQGQDQGQGQGQGQDGGQQQDTGGSTSPSLQQALQDIEDAYSRSEEAFRKGDWEAYGKAQQDLKEAIANAAEARQGTTS